MSDYSIKIENLSKQYRLGLVGTGTLSHDLNRWWHRIRGKDDPYLKIGSSNIRDINADSEYVWALKDINIDVKQGEVLGIIGKNGAGKSTLLKILSRVTGPSQGRISYKGRIGSLLEVGTGFHQEMTGRENIYLNGAILGMTKGEIKAKFDDIIDFSGCARYVDTPVKRYSSGMMVRLGFAVAAFLEPEILVVDEVLAVGDAEFQKKAIGKMQDVSTRGGRTVLFVSHNMAAVKTLCSSAVSLQDGKIHLKGSTSDVISDYLKSSFSRNLPPIVERQDRSGRGLYVFTNFKLFDKNKESAAFGVTGRDIFFQVEIKASSNISSMTVPLEIGILIRDQNNTLVTTLATFFTDESPIGLDNIRTISCLVPKCPLQAGQYTVDLWCATSSEEQDWLQKAATFQIEAGNYFNSTHTWRPRADRHGSIIISQKWYDSNNWKINK